MNVKRKTVAIVMDTMSTGGVEKALVELLKAFDYRRYDVTLWLKDFSGPLQASLDPRTHIDCCGCSDSRTLLKNQLKCGNLSEACRGIWYRLLSRAYISEYDMNALYSARCLPVCSGTVYDCVIAYQVLSPFVVATALYRLKGKRKYCGSMAGMFALKS